MRLLLEWNGTADLTRKPWKDGAGKIYCINWQRPLCVPITTITGPSVNFPLANSKYAKITIAQVEIFQDKDLANKIREGGFRTAGKYDISESREKFLEAVRRSEDEKVRVRR